MFVVKIERISSDFKISHFFLPRDKRERVDPKDFTVGDVTGTTTVRLPGTVNGQQFIIQNCQVRRRLRERLSECVYAFAVSLYIWRIFL